MRGRRILDGLAFVLLVILVAVGTSQLDAETSPLPQAQAQEFQKSNLNPDSISRVDTLINAHQDIAIRD